MFGTLEAKLLIAIAGMSLAFLGGAFLTHKVDNGRYEALVASYKDAQVKALQVALDRQKALDREAMVASDNEAQAQQSIADQAKLQLAEVRKHVTKVAPHCVPYGLVRVLDAAAFGVSAERLPLPAGKSDISCTSLGWDDLASAVIGNFGTARQNAEQLNALSRFFRTVK